MANLKWRNHSGNACPSCAALHKQVHSEETWKESGIEPKDHRLYCKDACSCTLEETEDEETGDLSTVPLREESNGMSALSAASTPPLTQSRSFHSTATHGEPMKKKVLPILRSLPISEKLNLPSRAELLPKIESGELDHIDFTARVYRKDTKIRNPYKFQDKDIEVFARSFEGQPFLRNHDTYDIDARDGTIIDAVLEDSAFRQTIRLTTRRGMTDFVEGKIDRFSIGWYYDDILCSICNQSWLHECYQHMPGRSYKVGETKTEKMCELIFINPTGKETSAVNTPAVEGTGIDGLGLRELQEYKLELIGDVAVSHARRASKPTPKGVHIMKVKVRRNGAVLEVDENEILDTDERIANPIQAQIESNRAAAAELLGEQERQAQLSAQLDESNQILIAQCDHLLTTGLGASRLPDVVQTRLRKQYSGHTFKPAELQASINEAREELAALQSSNIQGPGRVAYGMVNSKDQFRLAVEDMFGVTREPSEANVKVARLSGIREAYLAATGDQGFMGGYYPEFALVTANFPGIVANVMNKMLIQAWKDFEQHYGWWKKIATIDHFTNLNDVSWIRTGTIANLPTVLERGEYTELPIGDNRETDAWEKFGGYVPLTIEAVLRDDVRTFRRMPREVALAGMRNISEQVAEIFTTASGAGPTMADGGALFNATAVTTAGGHANLLTTALGTTYTAWEAVAAAVYNQPLLVKNATGYYGTGKKAAIDPSFILVPRALKNQAETLFVPRWEAQAQNVAAVSPTWGGRVEVLTVPEWTDVTDFAAVVDPNLIPGVMIGEIFGVEPQIFSASSEVDPAMFANDESRIKVRQFLAVGVADYIPLHKSNVAG